MGKSQRLKGKNGELEIANLLKANGISSKRISPLEADHESKGDITVDGKIGSVKRGGHVPIFLYKSIGEANYLFCRRDREDWIVIMPIEEMLLLFKRIKDNNS